jgi:hypothetical protein
LAARKAEMNCPENGWSCPGCRACSWPNNAEARLLAAHASLGLCRGKHGGCKKLATWPETDPWLCSACAEEDLRT